MVICHKKEREILKLIFNKDSNAVRFYLTFKNLNLFLTKKKKNH